MTYPGPWEQGADYERPFGALYNLANGTQATADYSYTSGGAPFDDEMNAALATLETAPATTTTAQPSASMGVSSTRGSSPYTSGTITVTSTDGAAEWTAANLLDIGYYYQTYLAPIRPADAVGVEYEAGVTAAGATLHIVMYDDTQDSTSSTNHPLAAPITVTLKGYDPTGVKPEAPLAQYPADIGTGPHPFDFNMTPVMGPQGEAGLRVLLAKAGGWHYTDPNSLGLIKSSTSAGGSGDIQMMYTLHPPRHRWLYDTPPTTILPPLRQFPRDDNLGTSSAARVWPTSSQQGSLRRHGYY